MHLLRRPDHSAEPVDTGSLPASWHRSPHLKEFVLVSGAYLLYLLIRQIIAADIQLVAFIHAESVVDLEKDLGLFWEPTLQQWAINTSDWLVVFFNWAYILSFYPIIVTASVILYMKSRHRYLYYRNVVLFSFLFALIAFTIFPLAPPRMLTKNFVDTMAIFGPSIYSAAEGAGFYNAFAAMPSLHFGWSVLFGTIFFRSGYRALRIFAFIYPSMMLFTIVVTGNHYFLDAVAGGVVIALSFGTVGVIGAISQRKMDPGLLISTRRSISAFGEMCRRGPIHGVLTRGSRPQQRVPGQRHYDRDYKPSVYSSTVL